MLPEQQADMLDVRAAREFERERIDRIQVGGIYRIMSDTELQEFGYLPRVNPKCPRYVKLPQAPCTQRLHGDTGAMQIPARWQAEIKAHNSAIGFKRLTNKATGWVNKPGWPKVEQLVFSSDSAISWNRVEVTKITNGWATIHTQLLTSYPTPYWWKCGYMCQRFTVIDMSGSVFYPDPPGKPMIFPLLSRKGKPLSIELYKLA